MTYNFLSECVRELREHREAENRTPVFISLALFKRKQKGGKGPFCPRCSASLTKCRDDDLKYYNCPRHGFVREINSQ